MTTTIEETRANSEARARAVCAAIDARGEKGYAFVLLFLDEKGDADIQSVNIHDDALAEVLESALGAVQTTKPGERSQPIEIAVRPPARTPMVGRHSPDQHEREQQLGAVFGPGRRFVAIEIDDGTRQIAIHQRGLTPLEAVQFFARAADALTTGVKSGAVLAHSRGRGEG